MATTKQSCRSSIQRGVHWQTWPYVCNKGTYECNWQRKLAKIRERTACSSLHVALLIVVWGKASVCSTPRGRMRPVCGEPKRLADPKISCARSCKRGGQPWKSSAALASHSSAVSMLLAPHPLAVGKSGEHAWGSALKAWTSTCICVQQRKVRLLGENPSTLLQATAVPIGARFWRWAVEHYRPTIMRSLAPATMEE